VLRRCLESAPSLQGQYWTIADSGGSHVLREPGAPIIDCMGLRDITGRLGCFTGRHDGEWLYVADGSCELTRTCSHCKQSWPDTRHRFTEWAYANAGDTTSCNMERHCLRCHTKEEQTDHEWAKRYLSPDQCETQSYCARCGETTKVQISHNYEWRYLSDITPPSGLAAAPLLGGIGRPADICGGRSSCTRCGKATGRHEVRHEWGGWQPLPQDPSASQSPQNVHHCLRCRSTETGSASPARRRR
jgi:hypothetical protein